MAKQTNPPIVLHGQKVGRFRASWLLFKETWRFFRLDPEILAIPFVLGLVNIILSLLLLGIATFVHFTFIPMIELVEDGYGDMVAQVAHPIAYVFIFVLYVIAAFTLVFMQGAIAHTVITRLRGGNATLGQALAAAGRRWPTLLAWSVITATVGIILRVLAERFKLLGRFVLSLIGVAWSVLTYFVAPAIVIDGQSSVSAIKKSAATLRQTFGETAMVNLGIGAIFFVVNVVVVVFSIGLIVISVISESVGFIIFSVLLIFALMLFVGLLHSSLNAVLKTLLYAYVMEHNTTPDFDQELLRNVLVSKSGTSTAVPSAGAVTNE